MNGNALRLVLWESLLVLAATMAVQAAEAPLVRWTVEKVTGPGTAAGFRLVEGIEHIELMHVTPETGTYSHHAHILHDGRRFYATWSNHLCREDGPGQRVLFSTSSDGQQWTEPAECFPPLGPVLADGDRPSLVLTANGLHLVKGTVYAVAGVNACGPGFGRKHGSRLCYGNLARSISPDGTLGPTFPLGDERPPSLEGFPHDIATLDAPRLAALAQRIVALRRRPDDCPSWSFWPTGPADEAYAVGTGNWKRFGHTMLAVDGHRMCEPTSYRRPVDNVPVRLFRDLQRSGRIYASLFDDVKKAWSPIRRTELPDAASRSVAGRLPDGSVYLVGNLTWKAYEPPSPGHLGRRDPLVLTVSSDGITFDRAWTIRSAAPALRYSKPPEGATRRGNLGKGAGFQYPHATVDKHNLWVIYSIGKEDVAVSRIPLKSILRSE